MTPQLLPFQPRGAYPGVIGTSWAPPGIEAVRGGPGGPSLALRVGEFLRLRLAQVTFDPSQPPYDSVQVYGLEGTGSTTFNTSSILEQVLVSLKQCSCRHITLTTANPITQCFLK